jgi:hypothetical protein
MEATLNWSTWKKAHPAASSDDLVDAYIMPGGVLLATWKVSIEIDTDTDTWIVKLLSPKQIVS